MRKELCDKQSITERDKNVCVNTSDSVIQQQTNFTKAEFLLWLHTNGAEMQ